MTVEIFKKKSDVRLIAFYLPQYHPIPENDKWWGKGFTEWSNVAKAKKLFPGHDQPKTPSELGFYDLRVPEARKAQADLAKESGIEGFCYWHYWFAGKRLLERPFNEVLKTGEPDFPFCLAWANHTWSGIWHGCPDRVLIEQVYPGRSDYEQHFYSVLNAFGDDRYLKVDGKPIFIIYRPFDLPDANMFTDYWRELALKSGLKGLFLIGIHDAEWVPGRYGFDGSTTNPPGAIAFNLPHKIIPKKVIKATYKILNLPRLYLYEDIINHSFKNKQMPSNLFPCVIPNWDNTPRCGKYGFVLHNSTPQLYGEFLKKSIAIIHDRPADHQIVFVKSWNEWAEGNYLEPDTRYGKEYLNVQLNVLNDFCRSAD